MFKKSLKISLILICSIGLISLFGCGSKDKVPSIDDGDITGLNGDQISGIDTTGAMDLNSGGSDSGAIPGLSTINFGYDSANLSEENKMKLQGNAEWLKSNPGITLLIEGHCDQRGSTEYNLALGERRAETVKNYMTSLGINPSQLTIISYGKEKLIEMSDTEASLRKNRRANFVPVR